MTVRTVVAVVGLALLCGACDNKAALEKAAKLKDELASCEKTATRAEQAKLNAERRLRTVTARLQSMGEQAPDAPPMDEAPARDDYQVPGDLAQKSATEQVTILEKRKQACERAKAAYDANKRKLDEHYRTVDQQARAMQAKKADADRAEALKEAYAALGVKEDQKLYATFETSMGDIVVELFYKRAPRTVMNFVGLAEGTKEWTDPSGKKQKGKSLYAGTKFHRVIPDFMIQGGDPEGTGRGGPGYKFADEFHPELRHDGPGVLSMANAGPNTNGSQFFITERATPHLDNRHSVFGKVTDDKYVETIRKMARVEKDPGDRSNSKPKTDIILKKVVIGRGQPAR